METKYNPSDRYKREVDRLINNIVEANNSEIKIYSHNLRLREKLLKLGYDELMFYCNSLDNPYAYLSEAIHDLSQIYTMFIKIDDFPLPSTPCIERKFIKSNSGFEVNYVLTQLPKNLRNVILHLTYTQLQDFEGGLDLEKHRDLLISTYEFSSSYKSQTMLTYINSTGDTNTLTEEDFVRNHNFTYLNDSQLLNLKLRIIPELIERQLISTVLSNTEKYSIDIQNLNSDNTVKCPECFNPNFLKNQKEIYTFPDKTPYVDLLNDNLSSMESVKTPDKTLKKGL